ncbi:MAG: PIN/TRAM domain-containing protein [Candidatus Rokuibacteriota bacterium]
MRLWLVRGGVVVLAGWAGSELARTLGISLVAGALVGAGLGGFAVWVETHAGGVPVERLFWGTLGGFFGLIAGLAVGAAVASLLGTTGMAGFGLPALLGAYLGAATALRRRADLEPVSAVLFPGSTRRGELSKILDTSVIIDGRIADLADTGFLDGVLVVPQFVLAELQQIADSPDPLRRNRGKRGFDVLQRLQRSGKVKVDITDLDFSHVREVDRKLIELGKTVGGKVLTNDYNLNKMAELSGVAVLNLNELANALKPVVLPGEAMQVQVLREGKEPGQGVAYLDDGTMVVIDQGKRYLGQTVDVTVTSVLQTTAGRMIFTRLRDDESVSGPRGA